MLMYGCGFWIFEVLGLEGCVLFMGDVLWIVGKGNKEWLVLVIFVVC